MSDVNAARTAHASVVQIIQAAKAAEAGGRRAEAERLLAQAAQLAPTHPAVLNELGLQMMARGDAVRARELFQRATQADPGHPSLWSNLAAALHALELPEEMDAIERALALEPRHLASLLQKGVLVEAQGDVRGAASIFRNALAVVASGAPTPPTMATVLEHARTAVSRDDAALAAALEEGLAAVRTQHGDRVFRRVDKCLDVLTGKSRVYMPQPTFLHFPQLPVIEFFDTADFPWAPALEQAAEDIRGELTSVLVADRAGLEPYIAYAEGVPLNQWKELNHSRRWSAYFLWNQGASVPAHLARCPRTAEALRQIPQCHIAQRGPTAFFSILDANTHIPAHTGVTNTRLTVHLPLIVPPECELRVGSETRAWIPGQLLAFDDTIEHEAWNRSDTPRAVLIFDVWNPYLTEAERDLVRAAVEVVGRYYGSHAAEQA